MITTQAQRDIYDLAMLRDEARELIARGRIHRQQPIYALCQYISEREWACVEINLIENEFLTRDRIVDLLSHEQWDED